MENVIKANSPLLKNGSTTPINGIIFKTPPILINIWQQNMIARAETARNSNLLEQENAMRTPVKIMFKYSKKIPKVPIKPNSSAVATNTKSDCTSGTKLGLPSPSPVPPSPPALRAKNALAVWELLSHHSADGNPDQKSCHKVNRVAICTGRTSLHIPAIWCVAVIATKPSKGYTNDPVATNRRSKITAL